jgi:hypothetical protein
MDWHQLQDRVQVLISVLRLQRRGQGQHFWQDRSRRNSPTLRKTSALPLNSILGKVLRANTRPMLLSEEEDLQQIYTLPCVVTVPAATRNTGLASAVGGVG